MRGGSTFFWRDMIGRIMRGEGSGATRSNSYRFGMNGFFGQLRRIRKATHVIV